MIKFVLSNSYWIEGNCFLVLFCLEYMVGIHQYVNCFIKFTNCLVALFFLKSRRILHNHTLLKDESMIQFNAAKELD